MITCIENNFGAPVITLDDYQDPALCILNGHFLVDPSTPEYQAAERLEIALPSDFVLTRSAVSSVALISGKRPEQFGTILRCWIENRRLCIEKLTAWDSYGTYKIVIASGFVARGYRGAFQRLRKVALTRETDDYKFYTGICALTDEFIYLVMSFDRFPASNDSPGPYSIPLAGVPDDFECELAYMAQGGNSVRGQVGSSIVHAKIAGGVLHFRYPTDVNNLGGQSVFFVLFARRGGFTSTPQVEGSLTLSLSDVSDDSFSTVSAFEATLCDGFVTIDAALKNTTTGYNQYSQQIDFDRSFDTLPDTLSIPIISRGSKATRYRTCINDLSFNRHFHALAFRQYYARMQSKDIELFGTVPITTKVI